MVKLAPSQRDLDVAGLQVITFDPPAQAEIGVKIVLHGPCRHCEGTVRGWADVFAGRSTTVAFTCDRCRWGGHASITPKIHVTAEISPAPRCGSGDQF